MESMIIGGGAGEGITFSVDLANFKNACYLDDNSPQQYFIRFQPNVMKIMIIGEGGVQGITFSVHLSHFKNVCNFDYKSPQQHCHYL